jgi:hypothetical protein
MYAQHSCLSKKVRKVRGESRTRFSLLEEDNSGREDIESVFFSFWTPSRETCILKRPRELEGEGVWKSSRSRIYMLTVDCSLKT